MRKVMLDRPAARLNRRRFDPLAISARSSLDQNSRISHERPTKLSAGKNTVDAGYAGTAKADFAVRSDGHSNAGRTAHALSLRR